MIDRRAFVAGVGSLILTKSAEAQQRAVARIGFLTSSGRLSWESGERRAHRDAFTAQLRELGWSEGRNLVLESRYAEGDYSRLPALAQDLVRLPVDVIFANAAPPALAAKRATKTIPIVFETLGDPITAGLVSTLARPGGNLTGISGLGPELSGKRLQLLLELLPGLKRVVLLLNPANVMAAPTVRETQKAAEQLGLKIEVVELRESANFDAIFANLGGDGATAAIVVPDPILFTQAGRIQALLLKRRIPGVHSETGWLERGGLVLFGPSLLDHFRQAATLVDKILRGARAGDLPVQQSSRFELIVNLKTAKALGVTIPQALLARADQIIE